MNLTMNILSGKTLPMLAVLTPLWAFAQFEPGILDVLQMQRTGASSCRQLAALALRRAEAIDSNLSVFTSINPQLVAQASTLDAARSRGVEYPLHCVIIAVKDNIDVAGLPTTGGSVLLRDHFPREDATVIARLRQAGALILGKTNLDELAIAGSTLSSIRGQTLNPYDPTRFAAGSSGGSAAAVAAGAAVCALGTETVNSLRNPASAMSLVAMRTSHGVVSRAGVIPQSSSLDVVGPLCRSVADTSRILAIISGRDHRDSETVPAERLRTVADRGSAQLEGKRIGVLRSLFGNAPEHEPVNTVLDGALARLRRAGVATVDIDDREFDSEQSNAKLNVANYEFPGLFEAYLSREATSVRSLSEYVSARRYPEATMSRFLQNAVSWHAPLTMPEYLSGQSYARQLSTKVESLMVSQHLDALVYPTQKRPPLKVGEEPKPERNGIFASALGLPAIDIPAGFTPPSDTAPVGLPVGIDFLGRFMEDQKLLELANAAEFAISGRRPPAY